MRSLGARLLVVATGVVALAVLFVILRPGSSGPQDRSFDVRVSAGAMTPAEILVGAGDNVTLRISSDRGIRFHLHGYDLVADVRPGTGATLQFRADLTGRFEIEDEQGEEELGALIVEPR